MKITVFSDGSHSSPVGVPKPEKTKGAVIIVTPDFRYEFTRIGGPGWSDVAEYQGVFLGLEKLIELGLQNEEITWFGDNQFVMNYLKKRQKGKPGKDYYELSSQSINLLSRFKDVKFKWFPREQNTEADALSKL